MAAIGTRKLTISVDGDEVAPEVSTAVIKSAASDADFVSFADAAAGGSRTYVLGLTMTQDAAAGSLWSQIWDHAGDELTVIVRPYGNATASAGQPHFEGVVVVSEPDGDLIGGEANASSSARFTVDVEWTFTAKPTRVVA